MLPTSRWTLFFSLVLCLFVAGCPSAGKPIPPQSNDAASIKNSLKPMLDSLSKSGQKSSAFSVIDTKLTQLEAFEPELAKQLKEDYQKLSKTNSASEIKSTAKKMHDAL